MGRRSNILYVGELKNGATALHRMEALRAYGIDVVAFGHDSFMESRIPKLEAVIRRFPVWPATRAYNKEILTLIKRHDPKLVWFDKPTLLDPAVLRECRAQGRFTVHFTIDDVIGPPALRRFRNIRACIPEFDLSLVSRHVNIREYQALGARDVRHFELAYDDVLHRPPPDGWSDADRPIDVVFIGADHDDRPAKIEELWRNHGIATSVFGGDSWKNCMSPEAVAAVMKGSWVWQEDYVRTLWSAKKFVSRLLPTPIAISWRNEPSSWRGAALAWSRSARMRIALFFSRITRCCFFRPWMSARGTYEPCWPIRRSAWHWGAMYGSARCETVTGTNVLSSVYCGRSRNCGRTWIFSGPKVGALIRIAVL